MIEVAVKTVDEWLEYIDSLDRDELSVKARAANTMSFVKQMRAEGHSLTSIESVLTKLVQRMVVLDVRIPEGGAFDLRALSQNDF